MSTAEATAPVFLSTEESAREAKRLAAKTTPSFVHLRARLPVQGRTNQMLAATPNMTLILKTYANGGENALHGHTNEDHVFIVLQGSATFFGPEGEARRVEKNDCVLLPRLAMYRFAADEGGEPLVMVRVGAILNPDQAADARIDPEGQVLDGFSHKNQEGAIVYGDKWFG